MTGQYAHTIDAKGRLFIPAKLREELGATFHVTAGQDHCLSVYSDDSWTAVMDKLKTMNYSEVKRLRPMFALAADCEPDAQILANLLRRSAKPPKEILTVDYEPVTGSHVGPGALALFFLSDENVRNI